MTTTRTFAATSSAAALFAALLLVPVGDASACGGFFCNAGNPVNQIGEHILFAIEEGVVTAHIQIQYQGPSEDFSWVLPLQSLPQLGVGTEELFKTLRTRTDPQFRIKWDNPEGCNYKSGCDCWLDDADGGGPPSAGGGEQSGVDILAAGAVGPYDYKVVQAGDGDALFEWLIDNGYDVPDSSKPLVNYYSDIDFVFLALKLLKDKEAGDIQPIVLSYEADDMTCIPLRLTAIAADPDMPVFTWLLGNSRAVPLNYFHVVLNPKAFDWINCAQDVDSWGGCGNWGAVDCQQEYLDLVTGAANAANGRGFVTEFAGPSSVMDEALYWDNRFDLDTLATFTTPGTFLQEMMAQGFPQSTIVQEVIRDNIPKPDDAHLSQDCKTDQQFYAIWNIDNCVQYMPEGWVFDAAAMAADLDLKVVSPMSEAQSLFGHFPYVSRMFTTISPDEMTRDPIFSFNPDLPDVDHVHTITGVAECKAGSSWEAESVTLIFDDGGEQHLEGEFYQCGGWTPAPDTEPDTYPPATEIQILGESGPPETVAPEEMDDKEDELATILPTPGQNTVEPDPDRNLLPIPRTGTFASPAPTTPEVPADADDGCAGAGTTGAPLAWLLAFGGLLALSARRRRASSRL